MSVLPQTPPWCIDRSEPYTYKRDPCIEGHPLSGAPAPRCCTLSHKKPQNKGARARKAFARSNTFARPCGRRDVDVIGSHAG
eukprot:1180280-Prorocentrum_minimum.AAC.1